MHVFSELTEDHLKIAILEKIEEIDRRLAPITSGTRPKIHVRNPGKTVYNTL